jgi:tRNA(Ile)-lysidine synthase TilS/MesJ
MAIRRCARCILPETFPSIKFDDEGVCNYCRSYKGQEKEADLKAQYRQKFETLLQQVTGPDSVALPSDSSSPAPGTMPPEPYQYNVLMAYSGGKDSSYTLDIFKNKYKLSVLAVTFDHAFLSPYAIENIKTICESLSIDHIAFKPQFDILRRVFTASVKDNFYSKKSLERASTICSSCMGIVKFMTLKLALEKNIPFIGYGWSPGQAPIQSSVMKINAGFIKTSQKSFYDPLHNIAGDEINKYFLNTTDFDTLQNTNLYNVHPLAFLDYNEETIYHRIAELGWKQPPDTDSNSSNCLLNSFANQTHIDRYGYHPYAFEVAGLVRSGVLTRQEGIEKVEAPQDSSTIEQVKRKLGIK